MGVWAENSRSWVTQLQNSTNQKRCRPNKTPPRLLCHHLDRQPFLSHSLLVSRCHFLFPLNFFKYFSLSSNIYLRKREPPLTQSPTLIPWAPLPRFSSLPPTSPSFPFSSTSHHHLPPPPPPHPPSLCLGQPHMHLMLSSFLCYFHSIIIYLHKSIKFPLLNHAIPFTYTYIYFSSLKQSILLL